MAFRTWIIRGLILALLAGAGYGVWRVQSYVSPDAVRAAVLTTFADQFPDAEVSVGSARLRVFGGISVRDLVIARRGSPDPVFSAPTAVIYHDKEQINKGRLVIRKIELDEPHLRVERTPDGTWAFDGLGRPGPADHPLPTFVVTRATVTVTDRRPNGLPPLTLTDAGFTLLNDPAPTFLNLKGQATAVLGDGLEVPLAVSARLNRASGQLTARTEVPDLPLGPAAADLAAKLDPDLGGKLKRLTGRVGVRADVAREPGSAPRYDVHVTLRDGRLEDDVLPAPLERIEAAVRFADGRLTVEKATAALGAAAIELSLAGRGRERPVVGSTTPVAHAPGPPNPLADLEADLDRLELVVRDLPLDDALFARVPAEKAHKLRRLFSPAGTATVAYRFARSKPDGWRRTFELRPGKFGLTYEKFRYPVTDVAGAVVHTVTHDGTDETKIDLTGTAGGQRVVLAGTVAGAGPDPFIAVKISGTNVPIDDKLFDALPGAKYPAALRKMRAVARGDFEAEIRQPHGVNRTENVFRITVYDGSMCHTQIPYPLEQVRGRVTISVAASDPARPVRPGEPLAELPDTDRVELRDFTARHAGGTVWLKGDNEPAPGTGDRRLSLSVWGKDCPLDDHLRQALAALKIDGVWRTFSPRGAISFNLDAEVTDRTALAAPTRPPAGPVVPPRTVPSLGRLTGRSGPPAEVPFDPATDLKLAVNFEGPSVTPDFFAYDLDEVAAQVRYEGARVRVEHVTARHGPSKWRLDAGEVRFHPDGRVWANLGRLDVAPLVADEPFLKALPPGLGRGLRELNLRGPAELTLSHLVILTPPDGPPAALPDPLPLPKLQGEAVARGQGPQNPSPQPPPRSGEGGQAGSPSPLRGGVGEGLPSTVPDPDVYWRGELRLAGAALDVGLPLDRAIGRLACTGRHHGTHLGTVVGNVWLDRAAVADHPVTAVQAAFAADPQEPDPARPGEFRPPAVKFTDLAGTLFRGTVGGQARVVLSDPVRYRLSLIATDVRLEDVARYHNLGNGARLEGAAQASVRLETVPDPRTGQLVLDGAGTVDVDRGHLLNLPKLVPLLKTLKLQAPDKTAFEEAHATFTVRGDRIKVDHLDLLGTAVSLGGSGELDTAGEYVKFDVYTIWSQTLQRWLTTPFGDVTAAVSENLFKIEVSRGQDGKLHYDARPVPFLTDPFRAVADRVRAKMPRGLPPTARAAPK